MVETGGKSFRRIGGDGFGINSPGCHSAGH
jgi:hypothetical protein